MSSIANLEHEAHDMASEYVWMMSVDVQVIFMHVPGNVLFNFDLLFLLDL